MPDLDSRKKIKQFKFIKGDCRLTLGRTKYLIHKKTVCCWKTGLSEVNIAYREWKMAYAAGNVCQNVREFRTPTYNNIHIVTPST